MRRNDNNEKCVNTDSGKLETHRKGHTCGHLVMLDGSAHSQSK